jgi:hypothetical protein
VQDRIYFEDADGNEYMLHHRSDCCEDVRVEDVIGDLDDLVGAPILMAEEVTYECEDPPDVPAKDGERDSFTWTFYKLATLKGYVTIRFYGESNGYYSEAVDFDRVGPDDEPLDYHRRPA